MKPTLTALHGPPAVWTAFARQGRWKSWVLLAQFGVIASLLVVCVSIAHRPADIIVVAEDGNGTYVESSSSSAALGSFLREQHGKASDVTLAAFTQHFVRLTAAINSTTIDESWAEALSLMVAPLAQRIDSEAKAQKLLETYRLAQIRTQMTFLAVDVIERRGDKTHVRARVRRHKEKLAGTGSGSDDELQIDLVLLNVPRSRVHPDGLEVLDWRSGPPDSPTPTSALSSEVDQ